MSSPFSTFKEFSEAKGPIYTFANNPTAIATLIAICLAIFVYFLSASFSMKQKNAKSKHPTIVGILILTSAISFASSLFAPHPTKQTTAYRHIQSEIATSWKKLQPLALFGLVGIGSTTLGRKAKRRSPRQSHRAKSYPASSTRQ